MTSALTLALSPSARHAVQWRMSSTTAAPPDDVQALKDIILAQREQISVQPRHRHRQFGVSSEMAPGQGEFFNATEDLSGPVTEERPRAEDGRASAQTPRPRGARKPPL